MTELPDDAAREILSMLAGLGEAQQALERKVDQHFDELAKRMDSLEMRMGQLESRVNQVEGRLDRIDARLRHHLTLTNAIAQDLHQHEARHHAA